MHQLNVQLFYTEEGINKFGFSNQYHYQEETEKLEIEPFSWTSKYGAIVSLVGCDERGLATADGLNTQGLTVNVLYESITHFDIQGILESNLPGISINRWGQYLLDSFATVDEVVKSLSNKEIQYCLLPDVVPDNRIKLTEQLPSLFYICISDSSGDSAIIEYQDGNFIIYHNSHYRVGTNEPGYERQLVFTEYWKYLWGKDEKVQPQSRVLSAPGGYTSTQRFERASFNLAFMQPATSEQIALMDVKNMAMSCAPPLSFNPTLPDSEGILGMSPITIWINFSCSNSLKYYFCSSDSMNAIYVDISTRIHNSSIELIKTSLDEEPTNYINQYDLNGCINEFLNTDSKVPFTTK